MQKENQKNWPKYCFGLVILVYLIAGFVLLKYYRYQINPDGISYLSIAQKYMAGDFADAINGYWGPMISWLLMPFLYFSSDGLLVGKILALMVGLVSIIALRILSYRFKMGEAVRVVVLFTAAVAVLSFAYSDITPDLLVMCMVLCYLAVIFGDDYTQKKRKGLLCGIFGGFAYLSKSYGLPFFIAHFFLMNVIYYFRCPTKEAKKIVIQNFLTGIALFAVISGVWVGLISNKYGELTIGTTGKRAYQAKVMPGTKGEAILWQGFLEPPNKTAISAWEDSSFLEMEPRPPMTFGHLVKNQIRVTAGLISKMAGIFMDFSILSIAIGIAYVLFWLRKFNIKTMAPEILYPTITIAIYLGGYSLVWVRARYLWVICLMLMLMAGYLLSRLFENKFFTKPIKAVLLIVLFLTFAIPARGELKKYAHRGESMRGLSQVLKTRITPDHKIAANTNWGGSLFIAYHLDCKFYGVQKQKTTRMELKQDLEKFGIDYYFVWGRGTPDLRFLTNYQEITGGRIPGLSIYGLKK